MNWFDRMKKGLKAGMRRDVPEGLWQKCERCEQTLYRPELEAHHWVCKACGYHFRLGGDAYFGLLLDPGSLTEMDTHLRSKDFLHFRDRMRYTDRYKEYSRKLAANAAVRTGLGALEGRPVALGAMDFGFIGGSIGSVEGEKVARLADKAIDDRRPLILVAQSGGIRMQESAVALMQMAKMSLKIAQVGETGLPFISVLTSPTTGGVSASFAMLGDVILAEPGAENIGFSGQPIIKATIGRDDLPEGFQTAEEALKHGFVDAIVKRDKLKPAIASLLGLLTREKVPTAPEESALSL